MEQYRLKVFGVEKGFTLSRREYEGKKEREGKMVDHYRHDMLVDGRSKEFKDKMDKLKKAHGLMVNTHEKEINFEVEDDERAKQGTIQIIFEYTSSLGLYE